MSEKKVTLNDACMCRNTTCVSKETFCAKATKFDLISVETFSKIMLVRLKFCQVGWVDVQISKRLKSCNVERQNKLEIR
jgi:hypothetical protein